MRTHALANNIQRSSVTTQQTPKTTQIFYTEARYTLRSGITTQQTLRPPKTTQIAYKEAKFTLKSSINNQPPPTP